MADLKRRLFEAERQLHDLGNQFKSLVRKHENAQREFDAILQLLIGVARQTQERRLGSKSLRVALEYVEHQDPGWAIATDTPKGTKYVEIRAIRQVIPQSDRRLRLVTPTAVPLNGPDVGSDVPGRGAI